MQQPALKYITPEEYLALEEAAKEKHEYRQGKVFEMNSVSLNHNRIGLDLGTTVNMALKNNHYEVYTNSMRLWIKAQNVFTYSDLIIVCGKSEFYEGRDDTLTNPLVICEILSDSTKGFDWAEKFEFYRSIPAFQEYILIDQRRIHVEQKYMETRNKWILLEYNQITDVIKLAKIDIEISLREIYRRVEFAEGMAHSA